jgi:hypothetical protein
VSGSGDGDGDGVRTVPCDPVDVFALESRAKAGGGVKLDDLTLSFRAAGSAGEDGMGVEDAGGVVGALSLPERNSNALILWDMPEETLTFLAGSAGACLDRTLLKKEAETERAVSMTGISVVDIMGLEDGLCNRTGLETVRGVTGD